MPFFSSNPIATSMEEISEIQKSPQLAGISEGAKGAVVAAPIIAALQAMRGRSPLAGAIVGGLGIGAAVGLAAAAKQKYENLATEAALKYHMQNIAEREYAQNSYPGFQRGFNNVRNAY